MNNIFVGRSVRLRAVEIEDWQGAYEANRESTEGGRLTDEIWFPMSRLQAHIWAEEQARNGARGDMFRFMIERLDGAEVGNITTHTVNPRAGTFMYGLGIRSEHRRSGFASEAIRLVLRYYFWERRYQKVNAEVYSFNTPSIRLHERLGFVLEGRLRRVIYTGGQFYDALIFGMTREEFESSGWEGLHADYEPPSADGGTAGADSG